MSPQELIDKAVVLMDQHLSQIKRDATYITKDGAKGLTPTDAAVIERYTKLLLAMTKATNDTPDDTDSMSDAELEERARLILEETPNAIETSDSE